MDNETEEERVDRAHHHHHHHDHEAGPAWNQSPSKLLEQKEFMEVFRDCLDHLPEAHRRAFSLREVDGIPGDEICKILDITPTNLWVMLHRARNKLRGCLETNWFGGK
jgi:RNA polymerase sigma-70 factor (ECF subfamily)